MPMLFNQYLFLCAFIYIYNMKATKSLVTCTPVARELSSSENSLDKSYVEAFFCYKMDPPLASTVSYQSLKCFSSRGQSNMEKEAK